MHFFLCTVGEREWMERGRRKTRRRRKKRIEIKTKLKRRHIIVKAKAWWWKSVEVVEQNRGKNKKYNRTTNIEKYPSLVQIYTHAISFEDLIGRWEDREGWKWRCKERKGKGGVHWIQTGISHIRIPCVCVSEWVSVYASIIATTIFSLFIRLSFLLRQNKLTTWEWGRMKWMRECVCFSYFWKTYTPTTHIRSHRRCDFFLPISHMHTSNDAIFVEALNTSTKTNKI